MLKKYYKKVLIILCFIILFIIIFNQHEEKRTYEVYISEHLNREIQQLAFALVQSNYLYQEILRDEEITKHQANMLNTYSKKLIELPQKHEGLAIRFNRIEPRTTTNKTSINSEEISRFFHNLKEDNSQGLHEDEINDVIIELDNELELKQKIKDLHNLNVLWVKAIERHVIGVTINKREDANFDNMMFIDNLDKNSITDDFWVDLVKDLERTTNDYLKKKKVENIGVVLKH